MKVMQRVIHFVTVLLKDYVIVKINDSLFHKGPILKKHKSSSRLCLSIE